MQQTVSTNVSKDICVEGEKQMIAMEEDKVIWKCQQWRVFVFSHFYPDNTCHLWLNTCQRSLNTCHLPPIPRVLHHCECELFMSHLEGFVVIEPVLLLGSVSSRVHTTFCKYTENSDVINECILRKYTVICSEEVLSVTSHRDSYQRCNIQNSVHICALGFCLCNCSCQDGKQRELQWWWKHTSRQSKMNFQAALVSPATFLKILIIKNPVI